MGFLLGAFGKLAAGSRYRSLQARMMRIQSRLRTASRNVEKMEKLLDKQKKAELNNVTAQASYYNQFYSNQMYEYLGIGSIGASSGAYADGLSAEQRQKLAQYQQYTTNTKADIEMQVAQFKQQIEEKYEQLQESMLEPLKDEEDSLQLEKDSLESQVQIAKADYEACQKMEQTDAKNLAPNYTGAA